jgi:hypothetical protein
VSNVVLNVVVHVSRETIIFERSAVDDGASESRIGVKAGGMGVGDTLEGKAGTINDASGLSVRFVFNEGRNTKVGVCGTARVGRAESV